uniref:Uncharacterized protein n=1 Tax=Globisporangium ultimum (strain ATCC 200006 / CBS 805.95 / DAOM BR144) TaxID=431595 RepID=K3WEA4_GLOUD
TFDVPTAEADLYTSISEEQGTAHLTRPALAKIFVPKASEILLFQAILAHDERFLKELLEQMAPEEILSVRDVEQRSLYHYATLCRSKCVKALAFSHVNRYYDRELDRQIQPLLEKSHQVHAYVERSCFKAS